MNVAEKIQEFLVWRGMQQKELAIRAGIPVSTVNGYFTKGREIPVEAAAKMARALDVSLITLLNAEPMPLHPMEITNAGGQLVADFRDLTDAQQELILNNISLLKRQNKRR